MSPLHTLLDAKKLIILLFVYCCLLVSSSHAQVNSNANYLNPVYYLLLSEEDAPNLPVITNFTFSTQSDPVAALVQGTFSWQISDPLYGALDCMLDVNGDGVNDYTFSPCTDLNTAMHRYYVSTNSPYSAQLTVANSYGSSHKQLAVVVPTDPILPDANRTNWDDAGVTGGIPDSSALAAVCMETFSAAESEDITIKLNNAIANAVASIGHPGNDYCVVALPAGNFSISSRINLKSGVIIKGAGNDIDAGMGNYTKLNASIASGAAFSALGGTAILSYDGTDFGSNKGSNYVLVTNAMAASIKPSLESHDNYLYAQLAVDAERSGNDSDRIQHPNGKPWGDAIRAYADQAVGQMFKIIAIDGNKLIVDRPINEDFSANSSLNNHLNIYSFNEFIQNTGLENLIIERLDTNVDSDIVQFTRTANAWIKNVASIKSYRAHVQISYSLNCQIENSSFSGAHDHGNGGHGYGVKTIFHTNNCLIHNNQFDDLRHAISLQLGANGNVYSDNTSINAHDNNGFIKADYSLHGHYSYMNLFENNMGVSLQISDWYGPVRYNTFFKNHLSNGIRVQYDSYHNALIDNQSDDGYSFIIPLWSDFEVDNSIDASQIICIRNLDENGVPLIDGISPSACDNSINTYPTRPASFYK